MEGFLLYLWAIGIDFVFVFYIGVNSDILYLVVIFIIGILVPTHILKFRYFCAQCWVVRGLWLYDISYVLCFVYLFLAVPAIYRRILTNYGEEDGRLVFIYLYPFIEMVLELIMEVAIELTNKAEFFMY